MGLESLPEKDTKLMQLNSLNALSPLDGRYRAKSKPLTDYFSEYGLIYQRVKVEVLWLKHLAALPGISEITELSLFTIQLLDQLVAKFSLQDAQEINDIEKVTNHDVKAVEYWLKDKLDSHPETKPLKEFVHFACTSEDINNISYALMLKAATEELLLPYLEKISTLLRNMAHTYAGTPMMSRTHGQPATPTTVGKEIANVVYRLERQLDKLKKFEFLAKLNGAVGNYNAHTIAYPTIDWPQTNQRFIEGLGLTFNPYTTQIEPHDYLAEYFHIVMLLDTILIDFNRDIWGYISLDYFRQRSKEGEVGSSTMPHKINPIDFENSEGNLGLANALLGHMAQKLPISRWQRDLTDSTVLRNVGAALGYALLGYTSLERGLIKLELNPSALEIDLAHHWELLAEPIQTVMRRFNMESPYEQLKSLTRGEGALSAATLRAFIENLELDPSTKAELLALSPQSYVGEAEVLAKKI